ncbi:proteolysis and peptidolysis-related protein [Trichosporon asahii var. asahii CBS 8904]|uniref:Proteolysis and peptidolysis-related protein n=1 Tax=Trichosporon asahii var. asahii (strain CBS 8904) TaxID=1220162 RepID=K1WX04_TRIAC|nr:proteolysis and peptidolysis-related protein [Trichosporon asahii var. asahii CBS 8904]
MSVRFRASASTEPHRKPGLIRSLLSEDPRLINQKDDPDLEASDAMGWTPLLVAASSGHKQNVAELLDVGAKLDAVNDKGQGALHYAASKGNVPINIKDRASQHPLHRAATTGNVAMLNVLLNPPEGRPRTRLNTSDRAGNTPLHLAMESGHGEAAVVLIEAGADRERHNADSQYPEDIDGVGGEEQKRVRQCLVLPVSLQLMMYSTTVIHPLAFDRSSILRHAVEKINCPRMLPRPAQSVWWGKAS